MSHTSEKLNIIQKAWCKACNRGDTKQTFLFFLKKKMIDFFLFKKDRSYVLKVKIFLYDPVLRRNDS